MVEFLYATSHLSGGFTNPANAVGNTPSTWAGQLNTNTNQTSRWAIGNPVDPLTAAATQTIRVVARKGTNSGTPTIALNLYENGTLVQAILANTDVTSTSGQTLTGTFNTSNISNPDEVEIEVVMTAQGGSGTVRNSAQISHIEWEAATEAHVSIVYQYFEQPAFDDEFEDGTTDAWTTRVVGTDGSITVTSAAAHSGAFGVHIQEPSTGGATYLRREFPASDRVIASGWYRSMTDSGSTASNNAGGPRIWASGTRVVDVYRVDSSGQLWLRTRRGDGTFQFTNTGQSRSLETWYHYEVEVIYNGAGTVSTVVVTVDGVERIRDEERDLFSGGFDRLQVGHESNSTYTDLHADEFSVRAFDAPISGSLQPFSGRFAQDDDFARYGSEAIHGAFAARFPGALTHQFLRVSLTGKSHARIRGYIRRATDPTGHVFLMDLRSDADSSLGMIRCMNVTGFPLRVSRQSPFTSYGDTAAWPQNTVWRVEVEIVNAGADTTATMRVWTTDPESTGSAQHTIGGNIGATIDRVALGNLSGNGLDVTWDTIALSDGEAIGPISADPSADSSGATVFLWNGTDWVESAPVQIYNGTEWVPAAGVEL